MQDVAGKVCRMRIESMQIFFRVMSCVFFRIKNADRLSAWRIYIDIYYVHTVKR